MGYDSHASLPAFVALRGTLAAFMVILIVEVQGPTFVRYAVCGLAVTSGPLAWLGGTAVEYGIVGCPNSRM